MHRLVLVLACCAACPHAARADDRLLGDDSWSYGSRGDLAVDAAFAVGLPTALPTGMGKGFGIGVSKGRELLSWGARAAWLTATEFSERWVVTHDDIQLRVSGGVQHVAGRGALGLRLGLGATLVHESRQRSQGTRAGLADSALTSTSLALLAAADLDAVVGLHVAGEWLMMMSGGPAASLIDGSMRLGWNARLGVAWQP